MLRDMIPHIKNAAPKKSGLPARRLIGWGTILEDGTLVVVREPILRNRSEIESRPFKNATSRAMSCPSNLRRPFWIAAWLAMWLATCSAPAPGQASGEATQDQAQASSPPQNSRQSAEKEKSVGVQFDPVSTAVLKTPRAVEISQGDYELAPSGGPKPDGTEGKRGEIVVAPYPLSNPAIGSGVVVVGGYLFSPRKNDEISPSSLVGGGGFYTDNGSWAWGVGAKLYLKQDRFRLVLAYGRAQLHYDLYGIGNEAGSLGLSVPVDQGGKALLLEPLVRLKGKIFLGPRYQWRSLNADLTGKNIPPDIHVDPAELKSKTSAIGFHFQRDLRRQPVLPQNRHAGRRCG